MTTEELLALAAEALSRGALAEAEARCREALAQSPADFRGYARLGEILLRTSRRAEAIAAFEKASRLKPDHSQLFTGAAIMRFRAHFGAAPQPRPAVPGPRVQMTTLGLNGRFGNQLLQYAFVRLYAQERGLSAELPQWIGRDVFDLDDPLPSAQLTPADEKDIDLFALLNRKDGRELAGRDVLGYFCGNTAQWGARQDAFRALFQPGRKVRPLLDSALERLRSVGKTIIALHLRSGDFGYGKFWKAPPSWYLPWLRSLWPRLEMPLLYIAAEDRNGLAAFAEFSPWDASRLGVEIPGAGFLLDHHVLRHADRLAVSNSTFSFTAAMLNARAVEFMRPDPDVRTLVPFDPWAAPVLLQPAVEDSEQTAAERELIRNYFELTDSVLHVGQFCSPWTNLARATLENLMIHEAEPDVALDEWLQRNAVSPLRHLVVETPDLLPRILVGASGALRDRRIGMVHFRVTERQGAPEATSELARHGFLVFTPAGGTDQLMPVERPSGAGRYVAIHASLMSA